MTRSTISLEQREESQTHSENTSTFVTNAYHTRNMRLETTGLVLEVSVTAHVGLSGCGSKSWVVISKGVERSVTELSIECTEPVNVDTGPLGTGQPVVFFTLAGKTPNSWSTSRKEVRDILIIRRNGQKCCQLVSQSRTG